MKFTVRRLAAAALFAALGTFIGLAASRYSKPKTVLRVVSLYYKDGTTEEQKRAALDGLEKLAAEVPGIRNVWLKSLTVQGGVMLRDADGRAVERRMTDAFVLEFENEAALKAYEDHPARRAFEVQFTQVRAQSRTIDITNP